MSASSAIRAVAGRVEGHVQGVSFRATMQQEARRRGVRGWVRNAPDGSVEFVVAGDADAVGALLDWARRGPPGARVGALDVHDVEGAGDLRDFKVRH